MRKTAFIIPIISILVLLLITGCETEEELAGEADIIAMHETGEVQGSAITGQAVAKADIEYLVCKEYDAGYDIHQPAETTSRHEYNGEERTMNFQDECLDENTLKEYYCSKKRLARAIVTCENGCDSHTCK